ncbi:MAG: LptF/LptG family permease [Gemmatimonadetes bacterium]|nr:LptF/LptG family permease [Gemmatimonadota bacterium]
MKILSRYLLKEHLAPFLFALGALTGLMLANQVARQFGSLVGKGLPWSVVSEVFGLSIPFIVAMTLPMAVLMAVLYAFTRLGSDNEVTALKAGGVNLARLMRPVLVAGCALALVTFLFIDQVLPRANHRLKTLLVDIARKKPTFDLKEQMINEVLPGQFFLRASRIDQATDRLKDVVIYDLGNVDRRRTIYADSGYMRFSADRTDLHLTLFDGYVHDYDRAQATTFRRVFFHTDLVRVHGVSNQLERTGEDQFKGDREMSTCEMEAVVAGDARSLAAIRRERLALLENDARALLGAPPLPAPPSPAPDVRPSRFASVYCGALARLGRLLAPGAAQAQTPTRRPAALADSLRHLVGIAPRPAATRADPDPTGDRLRGQLAVLESRHRNARQHAASYQVEIHKKLSIAASCLVFVLIGAPMALRFPRGGVGLVIGASVGIFGLYYVGLIGGETLADQLIIPAFWAMWTPNLLMTAVGLWIFLRLGREHATSRGDGWSETLDRLRRWLPGAEAAR